MSKIKKDIIKIEILEDFRCFKKGDTFKIEINPFGITYVVGDNGSGKSTLLQALRLQCDSLKKINNVRTDGVGSLILRNMEKDVLPKIKIKGFDYDEVYCLDSVVDDPNSLDNSCTAWSIYAGGGLGTGRASKGEKALFLLGRFIRDIKGEMDKLTEEERIKHKRLFIIDEVDEGLDLRLQFKFNWILERKFCTDYFGDVLVVTHNTICMLSDSSVKPLVFDIGKKKMTTINKYIKDKTSGEYSIKITKNKSANGSEQNN